MEEHFFNDNNLHIEDYIDIDNLGLDINNNSVLDDDDDLPPIDMTLRGDFTARGPIIEDLPKVNNRLILHFNRLLSQTANIIDTNSAFY